MLLLVFSAVTPTAFKIVTIRVLLLAVTAPVIVIAPEPPIEVAAAIVTAPVAVAAAPELIKAPALLNPTPDKLSALATVKPFISSVNPEPTITIPVPKAPFVTVPVEDIPALRVPPETDVIPEYVFAPVRVNAPAPFFTKAPVPEIRLLTPRSSLRLKVKVALLVTLPEPNVPVVPPLPTWSEPAVTVVIPE